MSNFSSAIAHVLLMSEKRTPSVVTEILMVALGSSRIDRFIFLAVFFLGGGIPTVDIILCYKEGFAAVG